MRSLFFLLVQLAGVCTWAQERCGTTAYVAEHIGSVPVSTSLVSSTESGLQHRTTGDAAGPFAGVIKIPVVVHVVYKDAAQAVSDAQVKSQIEALNRDFRRKNPDSINTALPFKRVAADVSIEFYLATSDVSGRPTSGIVRKQTNISFFMSNDRIKFSSQGGSDAWDSRSYLNIWVGNLAGSAGFATPPGGDASKDGVVISTASFGVGEGESSSKMGRTAVHEVGHWLGLKHIWGDAACGDDGIGDTPPQSGPTLGCPTSARSSCNNGPTGDMYMNFMDYTSDACMNLFTQGQKQRMRSVFAENGARASLLQSKGLNQPIMAEQSVVSAVRLYPNPATSEILLVLTKEQDGTIQVFNATGILVKTEVISGGRHRLNISNFQPGIYLVSGDGFKEKFVKF